MFAADEPAVVVIGCANSVVRGGLHRRAARLVPDFCLAAAAQCALRSPGGASAYLIGASSMALWSAPAPMFALPPELPKALIFVACGMIWNGVRLFHGRRLLPVGIFAGAIVWLVLCQFPALSIGSIARIALGAVVVASYTFFIAFELWRERRKSLYSRTAAILVPCLHAAIFLMPLAMRAFLPEAFAAGWLTVFALETIIYAVGTAFIVLLMVKDHHVQVYRSAATTDHLTGLLNRRAFLEGANMLCSASGRARRAGDADDVRSRSFQVDQRPLRPRRRRRRAARCSRRSRAKACARATLSAGWAARNSRPSCRSRWTGAKVIAERVRAGFEAAGVTRRRARHRRDGEHRRRQSYEPVIGYRCAAWTRGCRALSRQA